MDFTDHSSSNPEHGGSFWMLARGVDVADVPSVPTPWAVTPSFTTASRTPSSPRRWATTSSRARTSATGSSRPPRTRGISGRSTTDGWKHHHPRHIIRVGPDTAALCPCHATAGGKHDRLPSSPLLLLATRRLCDSRSSPGTTSKFPRSIDPARPFELPLRLTEDGVEEENEGMLEAAREPRRGSSPP